MKHVVVLSGAGISAESGISTFRDSNGLWENHDVMEVASPQGWEANPELVLKFYNQRRKQVENAQPNAGHHAIVDLEKTFKVSVVTQNVDDLHERAGSSQVLHLHGEIRKVRSTGNPSRVISWSGDLALGEHCAEGHQWRPHIVWFGEEVPAITAAAEICSTADVLIVVGTSLNVYPAAGLIHYPPSHCRRFLIDPNLPNESLMYGFECMAETAGSGLPKLTQQLIRGD